MKLTLITFLLLCFSISSFGQKSDCALSRVMIEMFLVDWEPEYYIDFKKLFLPKRIKANKIQSLNFSASSQTLNRGVEDTVKSNCFFIAFKFNHEGLVSEVTIDNNLKYKSTQYFFEWNNEKQLMISAKKVERITYGDSTFLNKYQKQYFYTQNWLLEKIEDYGVINQNFPDSLLQTTIFKHDSKGRVIYKEKKSKELLTELIWKTEYNDKLQSSIAKLFMEGDFVGTKDKSYGAKGNIITEINSDSKFRFEYNELNQLLKMNGDLSPDMDMNLSYKYSEKGYLEEMTLYVKNIKCIISLD